MHGVVLPLGRFAQYANRLCLHSSDRLDVFAERTIHRRFQQRRGTGQAFAFTADLFVQLFNIHALDAMLIYLFGVYAAVVHHVSILPQPGEGCGQRRLRAVDDVRQLCASVPVVLAGELFSEDHQTLINGGASHMRVFYPFTFH